MPSTTLQPPARLGSQQPTWLGLPSEGCDNGSGDDAVGLALLAGLDLDPWEQFVLRESLMVRESNPAKWAAFIVWLFVGRQNGKGSILEARQLIGLSLFKSKFSIHTAHELKTTAEHFLRMQQLIEGCPDIERQVLRIRTGKGDESIEMKSGCRLRFISRSGGSGRGFAGVDDLYLDEHMFLAPGMMQAIFSTMAAKSRHGNPQMWLTGSAPYADRADQTWTHAQVGVLRSDRRPSDTLYVDYGTPVPTADEIERAGSIERAVELLVEDIDRWYASNPALGLRISEEFCRQELAVLGPQGFAVERLGLVIPPEVAENRSGIDLARFDELVDVEFELPRGCVVAAVVDEKGARGSLVAAGTVGGVVGFEVVAQGGVGELVAWLQRQDAVGELVVTSSSNAMMVATLVGDTVRVAKMSPGDAADAEALLVQSMTDGTVRHRGDRRVRSSILAAEQQQSGDRWRWSLRKSSGDCTALKAAALAVAASSKRAAPLVFAY